MELGRGLTVINYKVFSSFHLLLFLALLSIDRQKSQTVRQLIYRR